MVELSRELSHEMGEQGAGARCRIETARRQGRHRPPALHAVHGQEQRQHLAILVGKMEWPRECRHGETGPRRNDQRRGLPLVV
ncbi:hypothetical protein D3C87_2081630 [compost metagenome]